MPGKRSDCPVAHVLDLVGDRWTLLVIRDIGVLGKHSFGDIAASPEKIPPATLSARLDLLLSNELLTKTEVSGGPGRQYRYALTERGVDLLPVLATMMQWSARHDPDTMISRGMRKRLKEDITGVIDGLRETALREQ